MTQDEKAAYIQNRDGIAISKTHFISQEGAKHHDMPAYWASDGTGGHIMVIRHEGEFYLTQPTKSNYALPIPYAQSGRDDAE